MDPVIPAKPVTPPATTGGPVKPVTPPAAKPTPVAPAAPAKPVAGAPVAAVKPGTTQPAPKLGDKSNRWNAALGAQARLLETQGKLKEAEPKAAKLDALLAKAKSDPLGFLEEAGLTYAQIATAQIQRAKAATPAAPAATAAAGPDVKALEAKVDGVQKAFAKSQEDKLAAQKTEEDREFAGYVASVEEAIKTDAAKYPAITKLNASSKVVDLIMERFEKDGVLMNVAEAAATLEALIQKDIEALKADPEWKKILGLDGPTAPRKAPSAVKATPARTLTGGGPAPLAKPAPRGPPSAVRKPKETFAEFMARKAAASS